LIDSDEKKPQVMPCYPSMKLEKRWMDQHQFSGHPLFDIDPSLQKWQIDLRDVFEPKPCPLASIYILKPAKEFSIQQSSPSQAYIELLKATHTAHWPANTPQAESNMKHSGLDHSDLHPYRPLPSC
jgi:hypothetical protein